MSTGDNEKLVTGCALLVVAFMATMTVVGIGLSAVRLFGG